MFEVINNANSPLYRSDDVGEQRTVDRDVWNVELCGNHEMRRVFRDYVVFENYLCSWLFPFATIHATEQLQNDAQCIFNFSDCPNS